MKAAFFVLSAVLIVLSTSLGSDRPGGKQGKRIDQIESDFGVHFVETVKAKTDKAECNYWSFAKKDENYTIKVVVFAAPINATDKQVRDAIVSAMSNATFYEMVFKAASKAKQDNNSISYEAY